MAINLGAIPLSQDVLTKSNIGLWAFELDEGSLPRMYVDDTMLGLLGLSHQIPPEETYHAWYDHIDYASYDLVADAVAKMGAGEHAEVQYPWHHPNGETIIVRCGGTRNFAYDKGIRIEGCHQDVSNVLHFQDQELKNAVSRQEQKLKEDYLTIQGLSSEYAALHLLDLETGKFTPYYVENDFYDGPVAAMTDYSDFSAAHKAYVEYCVHPDYKEKMMLCADPDYLRHLLEEKKRVTKRIQVMTWSGEYIWNDFILVKFDDIQSKAKRIAIGFIDVDEEAKADIAEQEAAEKARQDLEEARLAKESEKERYNFLVNVAHELRTPLTLIIGPLGRFVKTESITDKGRQTLTRVGQQANRMSYLLNTVLMANKIEEGADSARPEPVNLNVWVDSSADEFRDEAENHDMDIKVILDPRIGVVDMDEHLCKIVFCNLMINSLRHNDHGAPLEVKTTMGDDGESIRVSVKDMGPGIGDIDPQKLFERYYRATEEKTGFGIGLAYSKTIVDAHHGRIGAYNNPEGKGATFWFELPISNV